MTDNTVYTVVSDNDRPGTANSNGFFEKNAVLPNTPGASIDNTAYAVEDTVNGSGAGNGTGSFYEKNTAIETLVFASSLLLPQVEAQAAAAAASVTAAAAILAQIEAELANGHFTGNLTVDGSASAATAAVDTNTTELATTAYVLAQAGASNPLAAGTAAPGTSPRWSRQDHVHPTDTTRAATASPTFTGTPAAPTAAVDTNTTQLATTAFMLAQAASATPLVAGTGAVGTSTRFARADHVHPSERSATSALGYATGAGGSIPQATSKSTGVTINTLCGQIITTSDALAASASVSFTVSNSTFGADDEIYVWIKSASTSGAYVASPTRCLARSFNVILRNISASSLSEAVTIGFSIRKATIS